MVLKVLRKDKDYASLRRTTDYLKQLTNICIKIIHYGITFYPDLSIMGHVEF